MHNRYHRPYSHTDKFLMLLRRCGYAGRSQLINALDPGATFGFSDPLVPEMMERVDCFSCRRMMELVAECSEKSKQLQERIDEYCAPTRARNRNREERYKEWQVVPVLRWFILRPRPEPDPPCEWQRWYREMDNDIHRLNLQLDVISSGDSAHWGHENQRAISRHVLSRFIIAGSPYKFPL